MTYYRGETRSGLEYVEGREKYRDGGGRRPKTGCDREIAFADSIGGAIYGSAQYLTHDDLGEIKKEDFLDSEKRMTIHVYKTEETPDYTAVPSGMNVLLGDITDFDITGEVRFCDRKVPVEPACSVDLTGRDLAFLKTYIYWGMGVEYFDIDRVLPEHCRGVEAWGDLECHDIADHIWKEMLAGDMDLIQKTLFETPVQVEPYGEPYGIREDVVTDLMNIWDWRCK